MSRLDDLLVQSAPLEPFEIADLKKWRGVLVEDCKIFGMAAEDKLRIANIDRRLLKEKIANAPDEPESFERTYGP